MILGVSWRGLADGMFVLGGFFGIVLEDFYFGRRRLLGFGSVKLFGLVMVYPRAGFLEFFELV